MRSINNLNNGYNGANNNYNSSSLTPSSSGSRVSRHGGDISSTQSSDFEDSGTNQGHGAPSARNRGNKLATIDSFSILERTNNNVEMFDHMMTGSGDERLAVRISSFDDSTSSAYRLTPTKRSHRNTSFAIMTELPPKSRSPSPPGSGSGRVSPFRGRGFRAGGSSRHTTPAHSPPPSTHGGMEIFESGFKSASLRNLNRAYSEDGNFVSKIPMPIYHREGIHSPNRSVPTTATHRPRMSSKLSRSMSNLSSNSTTLRPPSSPSKKSTSFNRLSPIIGTPKSSPEVKSILKHTTNYPNYQSKAFKVVSDDSFDEKNSSSSQTPSKIPRSTSFIQLSKTSTSDRGKHPGLTSRKTSPARGNHSRIASREPSPSRRPHRNISREASPSGKPPRGPSRATSPNKPGTTSRIPSPSKTSINKHISRLKAVQPPHKQFNATSRSKSPAYLRTHPELTTSNNHSNKLTPKPVRRGPSPNRLNVPKERVGSKSREPSPNRNKPTPKPTTRVPYKTNNTYKTATSKIDSLNSFSTQRKPKPPPKPQLTAADENHTKNANKKLPKTSTSSVQNLSKDSNDLTDSEHEVFDENDKPTDKPPASFAETIQSSANNVVSATTETATVPLHIEAPKPQITADKPENLLAKPINDSKPTSTSTVPNPTSLSQTQIKSTSQTQLINVAPVKTALPDSIPEKSQPTKPPELPKPITIGNQPSKSIPSPTEVILGEKVIHPDNFTESNNNSGHNNNSSNKIVKKMASFDKNSISSSLGANQNSMVTKDKVVIVSERVKPIQIQVKETGTNLDVQSGNVSVLSHSASNGTLAGVPRVPADVRNDQNQIQAGDPSDPGTDEKPSLCSRLFCCCKSPCCKKQTTSTTSSTDQKDDEEPSKQCFPCCRKRPTDPSSSEAELHPENNSDMDQMEKRTCWKKCKDIICCSRKNKVADMNANRNGCCSRLKCCRKKQSDNWAERRDSVLSTTPTRKCCPRWNCCRKKPEPEPEPEGRRTSLLDKKKSLTPTVQPEKKKVPSIDESLVEHTSQMRGAIPVLPVPLAWFCLFLNCILPGSGTIISGALCLCFGKPRFSVHDGPRMRVGAFIIDLIIGVSQAFTVLFCLVGWGWSIWWGVIMIKVARKHRKMRAMSQQQENRQRAAQNQNAGDVERGQT